MKLTKTTFFLGCVVGGMGAAVVPLLLTSTHAETKLLPFQGRLTDAAGTAIPDGAKVVEFKMYDAPTGGTVKWAGEVHKLSVNGGLVNTMLGSKATLGGVDFATSVFLQITVDANGDGQITAADPPLLPRQSVVPAVYAAVTGQMQYVVPASGGKPATVASKGWDAVFDNGNPETGHISGGKLTAGSITAQQLAPGAVDATQIKDGAVTTAKMASGAVDSLIGTDAITSAKIKDGEVHGLDLAANSVTAEKIANQAVNSAHIADQGIAPVKIAQDYAVFQQEENATVSGGSSPGGWVRRILNAGPDGVSIKRNGSTVSLQPGIYFIDAFGPCYATGRNQLVLRDVTDNPPEPVVVVRGTNDYGRNAVQGGSTIKGYLTVTGSIRSYELWHYFELADGYPSRLGHEASAGGQPGTPTRGVFSRIHIQKVK